MQGKMGTLLWQECRLLRSLPETLLAILLGAFLALSALPSNAAEPKITEASKTPAPVTPAPSPPSGIPVEEVAMQATQVGDLLRGFTTNLAPGSEIETIREIVPQLSLDIALELKSTTNILKDQPALETLEAQEQIWQQRQLQLTAWLNVLTHRPRQNWNSSAVIAMAPLSYPLNSHRYR